MRREMCSAPQKRLKVARIIARLNIGGPAIQACYLHQALRPEFDTVLITGRLDEGEGDMSYLLKSDDGVQWLGTMSRPVRIWSDITSLFRLVRILRRERPDIVHTHTAKAGTIGRVAALFAGVPVLVHTYHGHIFRGKYFGPAVTRVFLAIERFGVADDFTSILKPPYRRSTASHSTLGLSKTPSATPIMYSAKIERFRFDNTSE